jgi:hypothetical protein
MLSGRYTRVHRANVHIRIHGNGRAHSREIVPDGEESLYRLLKALSSAQ